MAEAAQAIGAVMIYISTDYVFDGTKHEEYMVDDLANPKSEYGRAKYEGERAVRSIYSHYYIIRTSWVFGEYSAKILFTPCAV